MRRLVLLVVLALSAPASAESSETKTAPAPTSETPKAPATDNPNAKLDWKGASGYWTNPYPAKGGAYRWRMMAIGGVLLAITGVLVFRLVKRANAERDGRK